MPRIVITDECHQMIKANARLHYKETGTRLPEGTWSVPIGQDTLDRIREHQMNGETISDVIIRGLSPRQ